MNPQNEGLYFDVLPKALFQRIASFLQLNQSQQILLAFMSVCKSWRMYGFENVTEIPFALTKQNTSFWKKFQSTTSAHATFLPSKFGLNAQFFEIPTLERLTLTLKSGKKEPFALEPSVGDFLGKCSRLTHLTLKDSHKSSSYIAYSFFSKLKSLEMVNHGLVFDTVGTALKHLKMENGNIAKSRTYQPKTYPQFLTFEGNHCEFSIDLKIAPIRTIVWEGRLKFELLNQLTLQHLEIHDEKLQNIIWTKNLVRLTTLKVICDQNAFAGLHILAPLTSLRVLHLNSCTEFNQFTWKFNEISLLTNLESLCVGFVMHFTSIQLLSALKKLTKIEFLSLDDVGIRSAVTASSIKSLQILDPFQEHVDVTFMKEWVNFEHLRELKLNLFSVNPENVLKTLALLTQLNRLTLVNVKSSGLDSVLHLSSLVNAVAIRVEPPAVGVQYQRLKQTVPTLY